MTDISLLGRVINDKLYIYFYFTSDKYKKVQIKEFADIYVDCLNRIAEYCLSKDDHIKTKSDITYSEDIDGAEFDEISSLFS